MTQEEAIRRTLEIAQACKEEAPAFAALLTSVVAASAAGGEYQRKMVELVTAQVVAMAQQMMRENPEAFKGIAGLLDQ